MHSMATINWKWKQGPNEPYFTPNEAKGLKSSSQCSKAFIILFSVPPHYPKTLAPSNVQCNQGSRSHESHLDETQKRRAQAGRQNTLSEPRISFLLLWFWNAEINRILSLTGILPKKKKDNAEGWLSLCSYVFMLLLEQIVKEVLFSFLNVSFYWAIHSAVVTTY